MPHESTPIRPILIVNGGDVGNTLPAKRLWDILGDHDIDAIAIGGDIAYDDNIIDCYWTYDNLIHSYELMNKKLGRMVLNTIIIQKVPLILGLGNHDVGLNGNSHREVKLSENSALPMTLTFFP